MKLTIKGLTKNYGKVCALSQFTYEFAPGIYGILGANGAGKSTLFGLLTDTVRRDSGEILWDGVDILKLGREYRAKVGYMPQVQGYYPQMTATEFLYYMGKLKGLPSKVLKQRTEHLLTEVDLSTSANQKLGHFSCGMRQRALLAQAMLGNPPLLILDEPTAGVDPYERVRIRSLIARVAQNHIVLLATHIVSDIECIANQVLLMNKGNLLKAGTAAELPFASTHDEDNGIVDPIEYLEARYPDATIKNAGYYNIGDNSIFGYKIKEWNACAVYGVAAIIHYYLPTYSCNTIASHCEQIARDKGYATLEYNDDGELEWNYYIDLGNLAPFARECAAYYNLDKSISSSMLTWSTGTSEISNGRPILLSIWHSDQYEDHTVTAFAWTRFQVSGVGTYMDFFKVKAGRVTASRYVCYQTVTGSFITKFV